MSKASRPRWPLKTLIEILPVIIALTAVFSYSTIRNVTKVDLVTPLGQVLGSVPLWVVGLMGLILLLGLCGMGWLIYIFSRAPLASGGNDEAYDTRTETVNAPLPTAQPASSNLTAVLIAVVVVAMVIIALLTVTAITSGPPAV